MLEPTLLSRCWVVGGWTALTGFAISSPTSKKQRNRGRQKSTTVLFHFKPATCQRGFSRLVSSVVLHPFRVCHPNLLTPHKVKHINEFICTSFPPPHPPQPDRMLTVQKLSLEISPRPPPKNTHVPTFYPTSHHL